MSKDAPGSNDTRALASVSDADRCSYIAELCLELRELASRPRLRDLTYLLDLARAEAEHMATQLRDDSGRP